MMSEEKPKRGGFQRREPTEAEFREKSRLTLAHSSDEYRFGTGPEKDKGRMERTELWCVRTSGVLKADYVAILKGIQKIIDESQRAITIVDYDIWNVGPGDFQSSDWYQEQALLSSNRGYGSQANAEVLANLCIREPHQKKPHLDLIVVDKDITIGDFRFVYGFTQYPVQVISTKRFLSVEKHLRERCLMLVAAHEFGHGLGLVNRSSNYGFHCAGKKGRCLMQSIEYGDHFVRLEEQAVLVTPQKKWLCEECFAEVAYKRETLRKNRVYW